MKHLLVAALLAATLASGLVRSALVTAQAPEPKVILITFDGARTEEIFGGLDVDVLRQRCAKVRRSKTTRRTHGSGHRHPRRGARS